MGGVQGDRNPGDERPVWDEPDPETRGEKTKVWACSRMIQEMDDIPLRRWNHLKLSRYGMNRAKKSKHEYFDFDVMV